MARNIWEGLGAGIIGAGNAVGSAISQMPTKEEKELMRLKLLAGQQGIDSGNIDMQQKQAEAEALAGERETRKSDLSELGRIGSLVDYSKKGLSGQPSIEMGADKGMFDAIANMKTQDPQAGSMSLPSQSPMAKQSPLQIARGSQKLLSSAQPEAKSYLENLGKEEEEKGIVTQREQFDYKKKYDEQEAKLKKQAIENDFLKATVKNKGDSVKAEMDLSDKYNKDSRKKTLEEIRTSSRSLNAAWESYNSGDKKGLGAVDQALITLFNKMLDPGSVVRESEYARTPENMAYMDSLGAKLEKFRKGGAGLDDAFRQELVKVAGTLSGAAEEGFASVVGDYIDNASAWELNPERIVGSDIAIYNKYRKKTGNSVGRFQIVEE